MKLTRPSPAHALKYIGQRGYASYSSLAHFMNGTDPADRGDSNAPAFRFGTEFHSRYLERITLETLDPKEEVILQGMMKSLKQNKIAAQLMHKAYVEVGFIHDLFGVPVKGRIDIFKPIKYVADLKSTSQTTKAGFEASMDPMQPALYVEITGVPEFYYIGVSKKPPHEVFILRYTRKDLRPHIQGIKEILLEVKDAL